jgi:choline dehydrogenase-like flavoprotein
MSRPDPDVIIVGAGPCGSLVASELAERGFSVLVLEAGRRFEPGTDLANSEANGGKIIWNEPRTYTGKTPILPKAGIGVGGGTLAWLGVMPRFHPADFRTHSTEGVGADWPISYDDLRPYYEKVERDFGVAGECGPFAPESYELPMPPHRMNWHAQLLARGAEQLGARPFAPPIAINSTPYDGRPACVYCGWCGSGCPCDAKATGQNVYLTKAEKLGTRTISEAFVHRVNYDAATGRVTGVEYLDAERKEHRVNARIIVLAAHALETPRLLMQDFYRPDPANGYARGFILVSYMMTPVTYANLSGSFYGAEYKQFLHDYAHTAAWWAHAEGLPFAHNTVTIDPELKDARGLPTVRLTYEWGENDIKLAAAARDKAAEMMAASGARKVRIGLNYGAHAMGSCRMGDDPGASVVNDRCQSHDIPNLFICDTSVLVTGAGVNPTLTAMAIASRAAEHIAASAKRGEL